MADSDYLQNEIRKLQVQINKQSAYIQRLHGLITQPPSTLARVRKEMSRVTGDLLGTANQVTVTNGTDSVVKENNVTLSLPQNIHAGASPTFAGLTLTGLAGLLLATAGVISALGTTGTGNAVRTGSPTIQTPKITDLPAYVNNAAAIAGGLVANDLYRTGGDPDTICVVV